MYNKFYQYYFYILEKVKKFNKSLFNITIIKFIFADSFHKSLITQK